MSCKNDPSIEQMIKDLFGGGWERIRFDLWRNLSGRIYRGPHKAWHVWAGTEMDKP